MEKFINKIAQTIYASKKDQLEDLCIVLPISLFSPFYGCLRFILLKIG